ncbi:MAG: sodium:solute symporter, partial [Kiritimatiellae bacterium]|nr:sodium:solute symporter [Kiritimatiellia bacterium]
VYFMRRNKSSDDYFRAGGKLPWWVVSLSIYATMFSSITFISVPAMSYLDDCRYYVISFGILILAPVVAKWYLPFFRRLDLTSAYEFLEVRFNLACRLFASAAFILFMVARTAVVTYLPAIAITAVTDLDVNVAIVAVTLVTILYCTIGGVEAVIWSDFVQSIILIASTALIIVLLICGTDGGLAGFVKMGSEANKFRVFEFAFDWSKPCFWVVLIGGLVANLASYTSDQCVVQRYMTTPDERGAAKSIIFNGVLSFLNCFVFFFLGVALWTFYRSNPALLDVTMQKNDSVLPLFMGNDLPLGVSGLVLAAVAAATMSTLSANLNSAASAFTTDFYRRFRASADDRALLRCGKVCTVVVGLLGGGFALLLANADIGNIYEQFQRFLGVLTGGLGCLFFMGIFMKRVSGRAALAGLVANYAVCFGLDQVSFAGKPHLLLYGFLGMVACLVTALAASLCDFKTEKEKR